MGLINGELSPEQIIRKEANLPPVSVFLPPQVLSIPLRDRELAPPDVPNGRTSSAPSSA